MKITSIKGMHDVGPPEIAVWNSVEKIAREIFEPAGFSELRTPILEEEALFTRSLGGTTEVVEKEMYSFLDRKGKKLALRPEGTASIVRAYIERYVGDGRYSRFYYTGPMYRSERPQKGRYRQFYQIGAEIFGSTHPYTDAELIHLADEIFKRLKLQNVKLELNSLGCKKCRPTFRQALLQFLKPILNQLCDDCNRRVERNPLRALDCKKEGCIQATAGAPSPIDYLCEECKTHFEGVQKGLKVLSTPYELNPRMVRGLDYYERTAFEFLSNELGAQNAVAGGGRYDDLVAELGGPPVPGVGFALGMERLISLVSTLSILHETRQKIFFACLGEAAQTQALSWISTLRREAYEVITEFGDKSLKALLRQADRLETDYAVIVGENELKQGRVQVKEMKGEGSQKEIPIDSLISYFQSRKPKGHIVL
jgi:histidyl-tRNA synthetase